jgi:hypothetical protein
MSVEALVLLNFPRVNIVEEGELGAEAAAGQATLTMLNVQGYTANSYVVVGQRGSETAERKQILSIAGQVITLTSNLSFRHPKGEQVTKLFGDQIRVYKAANVDGTAPADDDFSLLATADIEVDQEYTDYTDQAGDGSSYWYKQSFYNSYSLAETNLDDTEAVRGGADTHYVSVDAIRNSAGLQNAVSVPDADISSKRDDAESEVDGACAAANYTMPLQTSAGVTFNPGVIRNITLQLSSGLLIMDKFAPDTDTYEEGEKKVKEARRILKRIGDNDLVLLDGNKQPLAYGSKVDGWPDETTADTGVDGVTPEPARVTMSKKW